jgi:hypothetical protein
MDPLADLEARGLVPDSTDREALRARIRAGQIGNPLADVITKVLYTYRACFQTLAVVGVILARRRVIWMMAAHWTMASWWAGRRS